MDLVSIVKAAIQKADANESKLPADFPLEHSLSGFKGRALIAVERIRSGVLPKTAGICLAAAC